ncbi:MAG: oligosaccharide flippase family protein [Oricola sp.]|nr:oligosaccharide flippase family protein [Oricola sp.]
MTEFALTPEAGPPSLTARVARGAAWIMGAGLVARTLGAVNTIVIARLLAPEDIGVVATAVIAMQLLQGISDIGVSQAVIRFRDAGRDELDTLFTLSAIRGAIIGAVLFAAAPFAAQFYGDPRVFWTFAGVALFPVLTGLVNPRFFEFERDLKFSREFLVVILNRIAGVAASLTVAIVFRAYWAIICGMLASGVVQLALSYALRPHAPRFSLKAFSKVFGFSGWLAGVGFMAALNNKLDVPVLARAAGAGGAGVYFMGLHIAEAAAGQIAGPVTRALYPGLSEMQDDPARMRSAFLKGVEALGAFAMPAAFGLAFVAQDFTAVVLGEKWTDAAPAIALLAPEIGLQSLFYATQAYAVALGLTRLVFFRELIFFAIRMPVFIWAAIHYGLDGAVAAAAALGLVHVALNLALFARAGGGAFWAPVMAARRPLFAVAVMALWFLALRPHLAAADGWAPLARLLADILSGALIYAGALAAIWRAEGAPDGVERRLLAAASGVLARPFARN